MEKAMIYKENPDTGDWLAWIPGTPYAWYLSTEKRAKEFSRDINKALEYGVLKFNERGLMVRG